MRIDQCWHTDRGSMRAMLTIDELELGWHERAQAPRERGTVRLICVRKGEGRHETPEIVQITRGLGLAGDRWSQRGAGKDPDGYSAVTLAARGRFPKCTGRTCQCPGFSVPSPDCGQDKVPPSPLGFRE